tara:strand:+ start:158 stop:439 length:282 start_codon:yes stop_codon:yes gene_type:complete
LIDTDIKRVVEDSADLKERVEQLEKQKEILKAACKKAGARIKELDNSLSIALDINDKYQRENEELKADLARAKEDHQYDNLVHQKELKDLRKK